MSDIKIKPLFIKTDTEGYDLNVLKGFEEKLENFLGIRCEIHFDTVYYNQPLFTEVHLYLKQYGFRLANLDYKGAGSPKSFFCIDKNYGILEGTEALYIKPDDYYLNLNLEEFGQALLFMLYNNLYDYAIFLLEEKIITNNISIPKESRFGLPLI